MDQNRIFVYSYLTLQKHIINLI